MVFAVEDPGHERHILGKLFLLRILRWTCPTTILKVWYVFCSFALLLDYVKVHFIFCSCVENSHREYKYDI